MSEDRLFVVTNDQISPTRARLGLAIIWVSFAMLFGVAAWQIFVPDAADSWRPTLYAYLLWITCLCIAQVLRFGEQGKRRLFVMPATIFVISMVFFPLIFGLSIAFTDWNLSAIDGQKFNGLDNIRQMWRDPFYWNALTNMVWYTLAILVEYVIAFGLALILNSQIRARKFFRVAFLLPLMLSPVAVSWMIGKSMLEARFGPIARFGREVGWSNPSFFGDPEMARAMIMIMDAWTFIPFMMIMLLAGLQAIPKDIQEAAKVDGATPWQNFREVIFPLMLPVSITAIMIRIIFKLKLADIIINVTSGGPGGATDSVTSFIFREYRDRSNVGYGTMLAMVYLVIIVIGFTIFMKLASRWMRPKY
ncbi:carbohydrate ABC transporter permease [Parasulfitobacter algicola]|uniref:Sugar ABC transporter permease n=1 Tax=Parasulfitobacter algicola TaxID=2614809 RepID=A0ABX2IUS1_9RHOB|nr:sugar ABC transporter permease [Sulfitobacter algicola]NSX56654.1 sugar ABC transporter permease [Sulfitobacter algicola]